MSAAGIDAIVRAQNTLMTQHHITSEAALSLLVWAATERGTTVLDVARTIVGTVASAPAANEPVHAIA